jgi:glycosyltransferase involved in cell wall biosynthesis
MAAERPRLVLMTADTVGGVWHYAVELAGALGRRGVRVALATMGAPLTASQREQIAAVSTATVHESSYRLEWMEEPWDDVRRAGEWLLALERDLRPDLVHVNQFAFGALPFRAPKLVVAHSCVLSWWRAVHRVPVPPLWRRYQDEVAAGLEGADLVAAPTRAMLDTLDENYGFDRAGVVVPNGRDSAAYAPGAKQPVILAAGRLWDEAKNLAALEAIAPHLAWPVLVAGSVAHPDGGVRSARCVIPLGELAPRALARHYARAAIYALPAHYEPFGLSVLEAALSGCALVLGDIPSLREIWQDAALFVAREDPTALRDTLLRLISDEVFRAELSGRARSRALTLTPERMARGYLAAYAALLDPAAGMPGARAAGPNTEARACAS